VTARRAFGSIRKLPSGRYQARHLGPDGLIRPAPQTFERKRDAELWLSQTEADLARGAWTDPEAGRVRLGDFADAWLAERTNLSETTRERYASSLKLQIRPQLGHLSLREITDATIRRWRKDLLDAGVGASSVAKAYRLLRAVLNTAVEDELIRRNPCRIKAAGNDGSPERPVLDVAQVLAAARAVPDRYRALVVLATFTSLRFGELAALQRGNIDTANALVHVRRAQIELSDGRLLIKSPKTEAGKRSVSIPAAVLPDLEAHLTRYALPGPEGRVFTATGGTPLRRQNFRRVWVKALAAADLPPVHFHDLRHTGNTLAAAGGASLRELMARMGHASTRAAVIYQHASAQRDRAIAASLNEAIEVEQRLLGTATVHDLPTAMALSSSGTRATDQFRYPGDTS
jgi:integrase